MILKGFAQLHSMVFSVHWSTPYETGTSLMIGLSKISSLLSIINTLFELASDQHDVKARTLGRKVGQRGSGKVKNKSWFKKIKPTVSVSRTLLWVEHLEWNHTWTVASSPTSMPASKAFQEITDNLFGPYSLLSPCGPGIGQRSLSMVCVARLALARRPDKVFLSKVKIYFSIYACLLH